MKRRLDRLSWSAKNDLKRWLKLSGKGKRYCCPWRIGEICQSCNDIFPTLGARCPCHQFSTEYVTRTFKEVVKYLDKKGGVA